MTSAHPAPESAPADEPGGVRVSVVVPVYRPGSAIDPLIASLDAQTLPQDRFELLLCDDGSGDDTIARLESIARDRPNVRILPLPHTGWPGTPRNHGIDAAAGRYLQFVDQDDHLFPEALERLCDLADEQGSDVVVGREVGIGRDIPKRIFAKDVPDARLGRDPLLQMLTPHKMFRTAFLRQHGIRFPDGKVRLEDHLFVMRAYFEASRISILASTPCYAWVQQPGSASSSRIEPETYFPHLEAVLDLVESYTEPGELRDRLLRHWLRGKILQRMAGARMLRYPAEYRDRFVDVVAPLVERRFGPGVDAGLAHPHRVRVALLRAGRRDELVELARFETSLRADAEVTDAAWSRGGGLRVSVRLRLDDAGWRGPAWLDEVRDATGGDETQDRVELFARTGGDPASDRRLATAPIDAKGRATLAIDPLRAFRAQDEGSAVELVGRAERAGWPMASSLVLDDAVAAKVGASPLLAGRAVQLAPAAGGGVELRRAPGGRLRDAAGRAARRVRRRLGRG
ncbi:MULTISPECIES: glycosyltransferase [unclassified Agrococcus]|uniref:glycosyltransferase n=1 Tax=unclassified Agrococcus TaxID=2615065 RepID=UPI00360A7EA8